MTSNWCLTCHAVTLSWDSGHVVEGVIFCFTEVFPISPLLQCQGIQLTYARYCCLHWSSSLMVLILVTSAACRHEILNSQNWVQQAQQSTTLNRGWSSGADRELDSARCTGLGTAQVCCAACLLRKVEMGRYCSRFLGSILTPQPLVFFFSTTFVLKKMLQIMERSVAMSSCDQLYSEASWRPAYPNSWWTLFIVAQ